MPIFGPGNQNINRAAINQFLDVAGGRSDQEVLDQAQASSVSLAQLQQARPNDPRFSNERALPFLSSRGINNPAPVPATPSAIPIGLSGSEAALQGGLEGALSGLQTASDRSGTAIREGIGTIGRITDRAASGFDPFVDSGSQSVELQAVLSGALGPEAQQQAFENFRDSPGQDFLRERGERAITRNSAAIGGLGGGRVRQELQRQGIGLAAQDFGNSFSRLQGVSAQGLDALGRRAGLRSNQANLVAGLSGQRAGIDANLGSQAANFGFNTGTNLSSGRTRVAENLASQISGTTSALANLTNQQGSGTSDIINRGSSNLSGILENATRGQADGQTQLAQLLSGITTGEGLQLNTVQREPGIANGVSNLLGGISTAAGAGGSGIASLLAG